MILNNKGGRAGVLIDNEKLKYLAAAVDLDQAGITTARPLDYMAGRLQKRIDEARVTPFEEHDPALRLSPQRLLAGCRSIIVLALPYATAEHPRPSFASGPSGLVARCARGLDYHCLVENRAERLVSLIKRETKSAFSYRILADRSPLIERELGKNAGLGWIGENCALINGRYGSYTALGTILLDQEVEADQPQVKSSCPGCDRCRKACPTGALVEPFVLDPYRCLSYLTQAGGVFPRKMRPLLENRIYGCDRCQEACPGNDNAEPSPLKEMGFSFFPAEPLLAPLLYITRKEFDLTVGLTSAGWRGKTTLQRNVIIALGNSGDRSAVRPLARLLENDSRLLIRLHAAWALGRIGGPAAVYALEKARQNDPESAVQIEAVQALEYGDI